MAKSYFKPFTSFIVTTCDGVDVELPTLKEAKRHSRELAKDLDMPSSIYEVVGKEGHDETEAIWSNDAISIEDYLRGGTRHHLTAGQIAKLQAKWGVTITKHA